MQLEYEFFIRTILYDDPKTISKGIKFSMQKITYTIQARLLII